MKKSKNKAAILDDVLAYLQKKYDTTFQSILLLETDEKALTGIQNYIKKQDESRSFLVTLPYSKDLSSFFEYFATEKKHNIVCLAPAKTASAWFQDLIGTNIAIEFLPFRIKVSADISNTPPYDQVLISINAK